MAIPDISGLTMTELQQLIDQVQTNINAQFAAQQREEADNRAAVGQAISILQGLLGPENAPAGQDSIRAVRAFDAIDIAAGNPRGTTMKANADIALSLLYEGMEILTTTVLGLAMVVGDTREG